MRVIDVRAMRENEESDESIINEILRQTNQVLSEANENYWDIILCCREKINELVKENEELKNQLKQIINEKNKE